MILRGLSTGFGIMVCHYISFASDHIMLLQLKSIIKEVNAVEVLPMHAENAELLGKFTRDLKGKVALHEKAREYKI